jgi:hypothetical protein
MTKDPDRRRSRRRQSLDEHGIVAARVRPGRDASLIDVSADGALLETEHRLLPGASVELHLVTKGQATSVRGRVLRCSVQRLGAAVVWYRGAVVVDRHRPWVAEDDPAGNALPAHGSVSAWRRGSGATRTVLD